MSLTAAEFERTVDIALDILVNTYTREAGAVHISSDMWNYIRGLGIDGHRTLVQLVKEQLQ